MDQSQQRMMLAAAAMQGLLAAEATDNMSVREIAAQAVLLADELLKALAGD